jgi:hypothetical protein
MASPHPTPIIAALGVEPTYSAREAAALLGRSYSWLDQRVRKGQFVRPNGAVVQPLRSAGGYRYFSIDMLKDIAACCYRHRWFSMDKLKSTYRELIIAAHHATCDYKIPGGEPRVASASAESLQQSPVHHSHH